MICISDFISRVQNKCNKYNIRGCVKAQRNSLTYLRYVSVRDVPTVTVKTEIT
jgi:hypothetical protein